MRGQMHYVVCNYQESLWGSLRVIVCGIPMCVESQESLWGSLRVFVCGIPMCVESQESLGVYK